jgi:hypothetical protein
LARSKVIEQIASIVSNHRGRGQGPVKTTFRDR